MIKSEKHLRSDVFTIASIDVVAFVLANILHEGAGHGGACFLLQGKPEMLTTVFFDCDKASLSDINARIVAASGSILNILVAGLLTGFLHIKRQLSPHVRYFLWLLTAINFLTAFGYLLFSGLGGIGDWATVIKGLPLEPFWRILEISMGAWLYFMIAPKILIPTLEPFLGQGSSERLSRAKQLTLLPYIIGGILYVLAGFFNPEGWKLVLISAAAASLGGTSLLAWYFTMHARKTTGTKPPLPLERRTTWLIGGAIATVIFIFVLGPGIRF